MPIYTTIDTMLRDVEGYVRATGARLLVSDDPQRGMVGFVSDDPQAVTWQISLLTIMNFPPETRQLFEGRSSNRVGLAEQLVNRAASDVATPFEADRLVQQWHEFVDRGVGRAEAQRRNAIGRRSGMSYESAQQSAQLAAYAISGESDPGRPIPATNPFTTPPMIPPDDDLERQINAQDLARTVFDQLLSEDD